MNAPAKILRIASLFRSNRSQAVRIPKDMEFPEGIGEVVIRRQGRSLVLSPRNSFWTDFFDEGPNPDFPERDQPPVQDRDSF